MFKESYRPERCYMLLVHLPHSMISNRKQCESSCIWSAHGLNEFFDFFGYDKSIGRVHIMHVFDCTSSWCAFFTRDIFFAARFPKNFPCQWCAVWSRSLLCSATYLCEFFHNCITCSATRMWVDFVIIYVVLAIIFADCGCSSSCWWKSHFWCIWDMQQYHWQRNWQRQIHHGDVGFLVQFGCWYLNYVLSI